MQLVFEANPINITRMFLLLLAENKDWFHTPNDHWGRPRFVSLGELDEPETRFLVNGVCVVEAEVTVLGISKPL